MAADFSDLLDALAGSVAERVAVILDRPDDTVLDTKGIADMLGMSLDAATRACQRGEIPAVKIAGRYRMTRRRLLEHIDGLAERKAS